MLIIDCPECHAQFRIPPEVVPPEGRALRCSSCGHQWHYMDPLRAAVNAADERAQLAQMDQADQPDESADTPSFLRQDNTGAAPASFQQEMAKAAAHVKGAEPTKKSIFQKIYSGSGPFWHIQGKGRYGYAAAAALFILFSVLFLSAHQTVAMIVPRTQALYNLLGYPASVRTPDVRFEEVSIAREGLNLKIAGKIVNRGTEEMKIKPVRVTLKEKGNEKPLAVWVFSTNGKLTKPGEITPFSVVREFPDAARVTGADLGFANITE